jgi:hypothetical protein
MKKCSKCKTEKDECEFFFRNKEKNTLHSMCKECKREMDRNAYSSNSNGRKHKIRERADSSKDELTKYVNELKKKSSCEKCGESRWYVLDFHHIGEKKNGIAIMMRKGSMNSLLKEISKCIILCSNCHRELHHLERTKESKLT